MARQALHHNFTNKEIEIWANQTTHSPSLSSEVVKWEALSAGSQVFKIEI
jgi:hypothetical protein